MYIQNIRDLVLVLKIVLSWLLGIIYFIFQYKYFSKFLMMYTLQRD